MNPTGEDTAPGRARGTHQPAHRHDLPLRWRRWPAWLTWLLLLALFFVASQRAPDVRAAQGGPIRLKAVTFYPIQGEQPQLASRLQLGEQDLAVAADRVVQFVGPIQEEWKGQLEALGVEILGYIPEFAYKVRMAPELTDRVRALAAVAWVGPFHPAYKLGPESPDTEAFLFDVALEPVEDLAALRDELARAGAQVLALQPGVAVVAAGGAALEAIAWLADVSWIQPHVERALDNDVAAGEMGAAAAWGAGYTGEGQTLCVADTGLDTGNKATVHRDLSGRVSQIASWPIASSWSIAVNNPGGDDGPADLKSGHGTHVAGSAAGDGTRSGGLYKGIAHGATLAFQATEQWVDFGSEYEALGLADGYKLAGLPDDLADLFGQAYGWGARVHTNSWGGQTGNGNNLYGGYDLQAVQVDGFAWSNKDMAILFSAGNHGTDADSDGKVDPDSLGSPGTSKNVITVGATENLRPQPRPNPNSGTYGDQWPDDFAANPIRDDPVADAGNAGLVAFSGRGPTDDGRIKPDVVAPGTWILSTRSSAASGHGWGSPLNQYYMYMGGTSMSTPLVAGAATVVREFYTKGMGHPNPSAALIKGTLINTATDIPGQYAGDKNEAGPIPNYNEGWGAVNLEAALDGAHRHFEDQIAPLQTGQTNVTTLLVGAGRPLKITVVWTDYPGAVYAATSLVNDLDLRVVAPGGTAYRGNVFANGWSAPGGAADRVNNVECVFIESPVAGEYTLRVIGRNVPQGPQPFALIVSGDVTGSPPTPTPTRSPVPTATPTRSPTPGATAQRIPLHDGWNWFSSNVLPAGGTDVQEALSTISGRFDLVLSRDKVYAPPPADPRFNTLTHLQAGESYLIRMTQPAQEPSPLVITGALAALDMPIDLAPGWNWLGYLPDSSLPVEVALASISGTYDLVLSEGKVYVPPPADPRFNSLRVMEPGAGYMVRMTSGARLVYPSSSSLPVHAGAPSLPIPAAPTQFPGAWWPIELARQSDSE